MKNPIIEIILGREWATPEGRRMLVRKYWHSVLFIGFLLLGAEFSLLEKYIVPRNWVSCSLDELIPFVPVFVVPYVVWFPLIAIVLVLLCFSDRGDFVRTIMLIYTGMFVAMALYIVYPHGQPLRPAVMEDDFFSNIVKRAIYANDTNTNCCPSIHVLNQLAIHIGLCKSKLFKDRRGWKFASLILTILICASTVFTKQHSIIDIILAASLEAVLYPLVFKVNWSNIVPVKLKTRVRQWELQDTAN